MNRPATAGALAMVATLAAAPASVSAEVQVGGWLGPRVYSSDSLLGYIDNAPLHPVLDNGITFGGRIARRFFFPWLFPEFELALAPARTTATGTSSINVFWMDPRAHVRFELLPGRRLQP